MRPGEIPLTIFLWYEKVCGLYSNRNEGEKDIHPTEWKTKATSKRQRAKANEP